MASITVSRHGRNRWLRIGRHYVGIIPDGIVGYPGIYTVQAGRVVYQAVAGNRPAFPFAFVASIAVAVSAAVIILIR